VLSTLDGINWSRKAVISKYNNDIRNPAVGILTDESILLAVYKYNVYRNGMCSPSENKNEHNFDIIVFMSKDQGTTWIEQSSNFDKVYKKIGKASPHGNIISNKDAILMPIYNKNGAFLIYSIDKGKTWDIHSEIGDNLLEPYVEKIKENKYIAVMRSSRKSIYAESSLISFYDNDKWSKAIPVTEPMQHPSCLTLLSDKRLLLTYSDRNNENERILAKISSDMGKTWSGEQQIGSSYKNCDFGYPSTVEIEKNTILTVFYKTPMNDPYFYFNNPELYSCESAKGMYYIYSM
jgi:Neuraminidase (sialidase)